MIEKYVEQIQNWNPQAFVHIYDEFFKKIYDFAFFKVGNKEDAEDITSETFIKAYNNINSFDLKKWTKFSSWLYTISNNLIIDLYKRNSNHWEYNRVEERIDEKVNIADQADINFKIDQIKSFLNTLDPSHKEIFALRTWNDMSYEEIASIVGKSKENCKQIYHRVLQKIAEKFWYFILFILISSL